jgi:hypothetical protein
MPKKGVEELLMSEEFFDGNCAIAEAQECRQRLREKTGSNATWCIVARKGFWPASYFFPGDEQALREKLNSGYEVRQVFAAGRRHVLARCTGYEPVDPATADERLRRFARQAMKQSA